MPCSMNNSKYIFRSEVEWNSCGLSHDPSETTQIVGCGVKNDRKNDSERKILELEFPDVKKSVSTERKFFFVFYFKINQQLFEIVSSFRREQFRCSTEMETTFSVINLTIKLSPCTSAPKSGSNTERINEDCFPRNSNLSAELCFSMINFPASTKRTSYNTNFQQNFNFA